MPILIKNESFNNIFLWKLCFIENNYFLCIVKLKKRRMETIRMTNNHKWSVGHQEGLFFVPRPS